MRLAVVGVGTAGCRIVDRILAVEEDSGRNLSRGNTLLIDTEQAALEASAHVPTDRRLLIGDIHQEVNGHGIDGDPDFAAEVARDEHNEIVRAFDAIEFGGVDGVLVVAGLAGGTGGGAGAVVLEQLQSITDVPVYSLAVLPSDDEGARAAMNAARSLQSFVDKADNVIAFDNETWRTGDEDASEQYDRLNRDLATRVVTLFAAGEFDAPAPAEYRMDPSDIMRTLDTGGISSIGHASIPLGRRGLLALRYRLGWLQNRLPLIPNWTDGDTPTDAAKINRLVRQAVHSRLTVPCEVSSAERALIVLSGPPSELSRKGFESGRYWLEKEADTVEVLAGDEPHEGSSSVTALVLLSNVTDVPRIDELQASALSAD